MQECTSDFSSSGLFAALRIAVEFCWHTQHKSVIGFMTVMPAVSTVCRMCCRLLSSNPAHLRPASTGPIQPMLNTTWYVA